MAIKVVTGKVRLSYANVWEARSMQEGAKPKFSTSIIISKDDVETVSKINKAIEEALEQGIAKFGGKKPNIKAIKTPLRDGDIDKEDDEAYRNSYFLNANTYQAPQIVDRACNPILDKSEVYSGCYARVSLTFYAYNANGNKGIACGLGNIQKIADGEVLGGKVSAQSDFGKEDFI